MNLEHQCLEWKVSWKDDHLREICAFANAQGGTLCIGLDDRGQVTGVPESAARKLLENLPNKVRDVMGVQVDVNLRKHAELFWVEVVVPAVSAPISCRGEFYYRSGSVCQQLTGTALTHFLLDKHGSKAINPLIARAFYRAGYVESWGRGIKRIADACREYGTAPQTYSFTDSEVVTVFESGGGDEPVALTERQVRILEKLRECPKTTRADLAGYLNVSLVTIKRDLAGLTEAGCIIRRGSDKNGEWFVNVGR